MKKVCLALILSLATMCMCTSISAAEDTTGHYSAGVNSYTNNATSEAKTVMIYKIEDSNVITPNNIYYINQDDSENGFSNLEMMMKRDAPAGKYALVTNNGGKVATFEISKAAKMVMGNKEMKCLNVIKKGNSYCAAFGISTNSTFTNEAKISMIIGDNLYTIDLTEDNSIIQWLIGPSSDTNEPITGKAIFAIQINGIGEDYVSDDGNGNITPKFNLYFGN